LPNILVVEDEPALSATIEYNLKKAGHDVRTIADGYDALKAASDDPPDLVVLDIMLPTIDGFDVCRQLRQTSSVPILILTARDDEIDRVVGLELGADDYLTKPFSMREFLARVKALLRRYELLRNELNAPHGNGSNVVTVGDLRVDLDAYRVTKGERELTLKPKERALLIYLLQNRKRVCTNQQLMDAVWGYDYFGDSRTLAVHIHGLREKLEDDPSHPKLIETVRGAGYRFSG
jgi:DNA-binding response OmpR family regulator